MQSVFASLIPVFLVIATGWLARATGFIDEKYWLGLEKVTYLVFFPALVIDTLAWADLAAVPVLGVGGALMGAILLMSALLLLLRPFLQRTLKLDGPSFTSVFQGATRWNTFVAIAVAGSLFGERGVALMAVAIAAMVPLLNVLAIYVFVRFAEGPKQSIGQITRTFVTNPFIWSCAIGLGLNLIAPSSVEPMASFIDIIGRAALPAGLLVVGAGLNVRSLARPNAAHGLSLALKLFAMPVMAVALARAFDVDGPDVAIATIASSVPTASASYLLAKQLGGNAPLMAEILTLQTLAALGTMPLVMVLLG